MKKLITLLLLFVGMVSTASADKRVWVNLTASSDKWTEADVTTAIHFDGKKWGDYTPMTVVYMYGSKWCCYDVEDNISLIVLKRYDPDDTSESGIWGQTKDISWSDSNDKYIKIGSQDSGDSYKYNVTVIDAPSWNYLVFRQNIIDWEGNDGDTWKDNDMHNTSHPDGDTFIFELTKAQIDASSNKGEGIRFRLRNSDYVTVDDAGNEVKGYPQIYPNSTEESSKGKLLSIAGNTTGYYQNLNSTDWYWQINLPSYDYEKIVITAKYVNESGYKWKISADAYVSKTVNKAQKWATLGCDGAALDLSGLAAKSITAYPLTVSSKGVITKGTPITGVLAANKGVLLETAADENVTLSIPVSAETGTDGSTQLVATTGTRVDKVTVSGYTNYILTEQDGHVGFYKVNDSGNGMLANTAYLHVADTYVPEARAFFWFEDETTGVEAVKASQKMNGEFFNLAGQRVAQPTKGLYIVNGKKVIMK